MKKYRAVVFVQVLLVSVMCAQTLAKGSTKSIDKAIERTQKCFERKFGLDNNQVFLLYILHGNAMNALYNADTVNALVHLTRFYNECEAQGLFKDGYLQTSRILKCMTQLESTPETRASFYFGCYQYLTQLDETKDQIHLYSHEIMSFAVKGIQEKGKDLGVSARNLSALFNIILETDILYRQLQPQKFKTNKDVVGVYTVMNFKELIAAMKQEVSEKSGKMTEPWTTMHSTKKHNKRFDQLLSNEEAFGKCFEEQFEIGTSDLCRLTVHYLNAMAYSSIQSKYSHLVKREIDKAYGMLEARGLYKDGFLLPSKLKSCLATSNNKDHILPTYFDNSLKYLEVLMKYENDLSKFSAALRKASVEKVFADTFQTYQQVYFQLYAILDIGRIYRDVHHIEAELGLLRFYGSLSLQKVLEGYKHELDYLEKSNSSEKEAGPDVYVIVTEREEFKGGETAWNAFVRKARRNTQDGCTGTLVPVTVMVTKSGKLEKPQFLDGVPESCKKEVKRIIALSPPWKPAQDTNGPVTIQTVVKFQL